MVCWSGVHASVKENSVKQISIVQIGNAIYMAYVYKYSMEISVQYRYICVHFRVGNMFL